MIKSELIKARCTASEKQYIENFMYKNKYRSLSETLRAIINNHMIVNQTVVGGATDAK